MRWCFVRHVNITLLVAVNTTESPASLNSQSTCPFLLSSLPMTLLLSEWLWCGIVYIRLMFPGSDVIRMLSMLVSVDMQGSTPTPSFQEYHSNIHVSL